MTESKDFERKPDPANPGQNIVYGPNESGKLVAVGYEDEKGDLHLNEEGERLLART
jgi:hypothetical protein